MREIERKVMNHKNTISMVNDIAEMVCGREEEKN
jgi:hypothetical protein